MDTRPISADAMRRFQQMLTQHFIHNRSRPKNPDGLFLYYFSDQQKRDWQMILTGLLQRLPRRSVYVDCAGLSARAIYCNAANTEDVAQAADNAFQQTLLTDNITFVLEDISRSKVSNRAVFVREILKMLDDAHFSGHRPTSDVILSIPHHFWRRDGG